MTAPRRGRPVGSTGKTGKQANPFMTAYTFWIRDTSPLARVFVVEAPHDRDASLALSARRLGVKVSTQRGLAIYGTVTVPVIRITKED